MTLDMAADNRPIGIFDSGIGGLTVLKEICKVLPSESVLYLGDTARVPYGVRSPETVTRYSFECADFLLKQDIKLLVVACNTVSSISLNEIRKRVSIPVVGVIDPGAHAAVKATVSKKIGVIGTEATVRSNAYRRAIKSIDETIEVFGTACPLFVPLVEEGWTEGNIARLIVERYLKEFKGSGVDTLVLGCTHYPLLKRVIAEVMGSIFLIDSAIETSKVVAEVLAFSGKLRNFSSAPLMEFFVTDSPEKFVMVGERFLNDSIVNIKRIAL